MVLRCGTAMRDITPSYPVFLHGYSSRDQRSTGVSEPLRLGCLAVDDGTQRVLLITADMIGISAPTCVSLYERLEAEVGIGYPHILLSATHTHFAPALHAFGSSAPEVGFQEPDPRFVEDVHTKIVEAARESLRSLEPVHLESARLQVPQVLFNRRTLTKDGRVQTNYRYPQPAQEYDFSPTDAELTVLRFRDDGEIKAAWTNFGCHPVTGGRIQEAAHYQVSADYPHYLRQALEAAWSCPTFFTLGAAGDAVPLDRYGESRQRIGYSLAHAATLADRTFRPHAHPRISADVMRLQAETIITVEAEDIAARYERARSTYAEVRSGPSEEADDPAWQQCVDEYESAQRQYERVQLYPDNSWSIPIQIMRLGPITLVGLPFEVLSEISRRMKAQFPDSVLVSCTGGYQGYLPLAHEVPRGGYEVGARSNHFVPETGDRLLERILEKLAGDQASEGDVT